MAEDFKLDISKPTQDFTTHLSITGNNRIIFSGPFGSGKTYFLNEYFKENTDYEVFHLYPVNYSISQNGDIFELIKFDLLFELLFNPNVEFEKEDFSKWMTFQIFVLNNQFDVAKTFYESIKPLFEKLAKIGKDITEIAEPISKLYEKWKDYHKDIQIDEREGVIAYLEHFTKEKGNIHEEDIFTQIIRNLLAQIKVKGKKPILIIDDLDRIDPGHIFRILNIFSAHFDNRYSQKEQNKFGFDQIMLVCDLNNIRNIFFNKYGQNVDFTGYIDKFYAKDVFVFDNLRVMEDTIQNVFDSINYCSISDFHIKTGTREFVTTIIGELVRSHSLNLRDLGKVWKLNYTFVPKEIMCWKDRKMNSMQFYELILIDFLKIFFGEIENLKKAISKTQNSNILSKVEYSSYAKYGNHYECAKIITLYTQEIHQFNTKIHSHSFQEILKTQYFSGMLIHYRSSGSDTWCIDFKPSDRDIENGGYLYFFDLFLKVIEMAQTKNYVN